MKLLSLNIWNYQHSWPVRRLLIAKLINEHAPDVVTLQETRHDFRFERGKGQGEQLAKLTGYVPTTALGQVYVPLARIEEGLTTLTHAPPIRVMRRSLSRIPHERHDDNQRVCLGVRVRIGDEEFDVYNTHFSLSDLARETNAREVAEFVDRESEGRPALLAGDLNAQPDERSIQFLTGATEISGARAGFVDYWAQAYPGNPGFTDPSWQPKQRIDYVLGSNVRWTLTRIDLVGREPSRGEYASDHLGLLADFVS
jgi:endonuclease/exonuclease/phosphatase family metal-dependent hydrolase